MKWHAIRENVDYETLEQLIAAGKNNISGLQNVMFSLEDGNYPIIYLFNAATYNDMLIPAVVKKIKVWQNFINE